MSPLESLLVTAITGLVGAVLALWRQNNRLRDAARAEQLESARLIFALLQRVALFRGELPPRTASTPSAPDLAEAKAIAVREMNGELDALLRDYLDSSPPEPPHG